MGRKLVVTVSGVMLASSLLSFAGVANATASGGESAAPPPYECAANRLCIYMDNDGKGKAFNMQLGARNLADVGLNDQTSSVYNLSSKIFCLYEHAGGGGRILGISPNFKGNIGPRYNFNDITSSVGTANAEKKCDRAVP